MSTLLSLLVLLAGPHVFGPDEADRARLQRHLRNVEAELRARDDSQLPAALQTERRRNLERLRAYGLAGQFPRNDGHPGRRVPYFLDADGVVCAVGHLVVASGHADVAREIHARENNARLLDMTHPALPAWIAASGLTVEECARIQPSYCECDDTRDLVCGVDERTYLNPCVAKLCADVEIAHTGACAGASTTDWPNAGTTTAGTDTNTTASEPTEAPGSSTGTTDTSDERTAGGCRFVGSAATPLLLLPLFLRLRRRTRT